jgi:hypothetical protein
MMLFYSAEVLNLVISPLSRRAVRCSLESTRSFRCGSLDSGILWCYRVRDSTWQSPPLHQTYGPVRPEAFDRMPTQTHSPGIPT